jgi:hypothetical protein
MGRDYECQEEVVYDCPVETFVALAICWRTHARVCVSKMQSRCRWSGSEWPDRRTI